MRFSGHETFAIREGWLYKGLSSLKATPGLFENPLPHDQLGVGSNMGKSIKHWLAATGLAERHESQGRSRGKRIEVSAFGDLVLDRDPYFNELATWAFVHVNLVNSEETTGAWEWFFRHCGESVFSRNDASELLSQWAKFAAPKLPSATTLQKDLNCLLASYAQRIPSDNLDPEEAMDCPLWDLGLLAFYRGSQSFRANRSAKDLPGEVIGYALASSVDADENLDRRRFRQISFENACTAQGGPGSSFLLGPSSLYETVSKAISNNPKCGLQIDSQAGQRIIKFKAWTPLEWAKTYYDSVGD